MGETWQGHYTQSRGRSTGARRGTGGWGFNNNQGARGGGTTGLEGRRLGAFQHFQLRSGFSANPITGRRPGKEHVTEELNEDMVYHIGTSFNPFNTLLDQSDEELEGGTWRGFWRCFWEGSCTATVEAIDLQTIPWSPILEDNNTVEPVYTNQLEEEGELENPEFESLVLERLRRKSHDGLVQVPLLTDEWQKDQVMNWD